MQIKIAFYIHILLYSNDKISQGIKGNKLQGNLV